ncbi:MAG: 5-oxoprolinase subunit PxpA [Porticoccaceae bacterium]|nr:5-oxoprolinase subunit PxpA [Porticoccaceae bacterium]MBT5102925.1 5-oxoprolinase subunit PxpA [Porticoccaceae bacterium]MBT6798340.1 5-oxoprolinase subunit PxpA [Porticoccaceae bacterium]MBT7167961.1 5-oxoprolinase subunit PxpA [Porticoccaceae bacterium]MBT7963104.1 5-oxoprolinase subunit PxpA [Porticoccaceae bacterium]
MSLMLNCDLGESTHPDVMDVDALVMPHIDQANIACGLHAGDAEMMRATLLLAKENGVRVGAHPSYPDREGFGRRSMPLPSDALIAIVQSQIAELTQIAIEVGISVSYVKPHGALYNDMMANGHIRSAVMQAVSSSPQPLAFMLQATPDAEAHRREAKAFDLEVIFEAFADRCYADNGSLLSRKLPGAVHSREMMLEQVAQLNESGTITTISGHRLSIQADSVCVHGDNVDGVAAIEEVRQLLR